MPHPRGVFVFAVRVGEYEYTFERMGSGSGRSRIWLAAEVAEEPFEGLPVGDRVGLIAEIGDI
jgi:hypothetical protein